MPKVARPRVGSKRTSAPAELSEGRDGRTADGEPAGDRQVAFAGPGRTGTGENERHVEIGREDRPRTANGPTFVGPSLRCIFLVSAASFRRIDAAVLRPIGL
jgi:hypothetical protein